LLQKLVPGSASNTCDCLRCVLNTWRGGDTGHRPPVIRTMGNTV